MKVKLTYDVEGKPKKIVANLEQHENYIEIKYREKPGVNVVLRRYGNYIELKKSGNINLRIKHELHKRVEVEYRIKMGEQEFTGISKIRTTRLDLLDDRIILEYQRDSDKIKQTWIYE